jgi:glycerol-3-phosphate dehydrogenase subunit C
MGFPAAELLGLIPGLEVIPSSADCCGIGGTYGYDKERFAISESIGQTLKNQAKAERPATILCDSETCRWHIASMTGLPAKHPIEIIAESLL